jgi:hypothetical protein
MLRRRHTVVEPSRPISVVLTAARAEMDLAGHGYVGLEHLLIALTHPGFDETSRMLAGFGVTTDTARDAVRLVVSSVRGDGPAFDNAALLASLGIDLDQVRNSVAAKFGPNAIHDLYTSPVGWNLRPRGPLCDPGLSPQLKRVIARTLGHCWDNAPRQLDERLLLNALDSGSPGMAAVLEELGTPLAALRADLVTRLRIAS